MVDANTIGPGASVADVLVPVAPPNVEEAERAVHPELSPVLD